MLSSSSKSKQHCLDLFTCQINWQKIIIQYRRLRGKACSKNELKAIFHHISHTIPKIDPMSYFTLPLCVTTIPILAPDNNLAADNITNSIVHLLPLKLLVG